MKLNRFQITKKLTLLSEEVQSRHAELKFKYIDKIERVDIIIYIVSKYLYFLNFTCLYNFYNLFFIYVCSDFVFILFKN